jgi:uncharacterized protein
VADFAVGAANDLPISTSDVWDGGAAARAIFGWAGGEDFDPARARRGFLAYDREAPELRGSYKLPFARPVGGILTAIAGGLRAAASRLPQADMPQGVKDRARSVLDGYFERLREGSAANGPEALEARGVETRALSGELRAAGADDADKPEGWVSGHASVFWSVDDRLTAFAPRAFRKSLERRQGRLPLLWFHDPSALIGKVDAAREDKDGLAFEGRILVDEPPGKPLTNLRGGNHVGMSFGFLRLRDRSAGEEDPIDLSTAALAGVPGARRADVRVITEVEVFELSFLPWTFAAQPRAGPEAVRSLAALAVLPGQIRAGTVDAAGRALAEEIARAWAERDAAARAAARRLADRRAEVAAALGRWGPQLAGGDP